MVWVPAAYSANPALYDDLNDLVERVVRRPRVLRDFYDLYGFGAGVSTPQMNENLMVFVKPTLRKHRLGQCLQRIGRPGARQHEEFDDQGPRGATQS